MDSKLFSLLVFTNIPVQLFFNGWTCISHISDTGPLETASFIPSVTSLVGHVRSCTPIGLLLLKSVCQLACRSVTNLVLSAKRSKTPSLFMVLKVAVHTCDVL